MKKTIVLSLSLIILVSLLSGFALSRGSQQASTRLQQANDLTVAVENKTQAFQIISAVRDGNLIRLSLRNGYGQAINAFTLSGGSDSGVQVEFTQSGGSIAPGAGYNYTVLAASLEPSGSNLKPLNLKILNVVFEDGTGDGDPQATADINNRRLGERIALMRIVPLLEQALKSHDSGTPEGVQRLKNQISAVCDTLAKEHSGEVLGGILHGKGYILGAIQQVEEKQKQDGNINLPDELLRIREHFGQKSARLGKILK